MSLEHCLLPLLLCSSLKVFSTVMTSGHIWPDYNSDCQRKNKIICCFKRYPKMRNVHALVNASLLV